MVPLPRILLIMTAVPIIVVYTMFDLFMGNLGRNKGHPGGDGSYEFAVKNFEEKYGQQFKTSTRNIEGNVPYTVVASTFASQVS